MRGNCALNGLLAFVLTLMAPQQLSLAANSLIVIDEILASWQGDDDIQFVELRMTAAGQNQVAGAEIEILDRGGEVIERLAFPGSVSNGADGARILISTPKLESLAGLVADFRVENPDLIPLLRRRGGRICYRASVGSQDTLRVDCVAYGAFSGDNGAFGAPTPLTPDNRSLQRIQNSMDNAADFRGVLEPTPQNNSGHRAVLQTACLDNGHIDPGEECDGTNLQGKTCIGEGFAGGTLRCSECHLDTSGCTYCGNGRIDGGEDCDGEDLGMRTCTRLGFTAGTLGCSGDCAFDTSACEELQIPGGGPASKDCFVEWSVVNPGTPLRGDRPLPNQRCVDGDQTCDFDGGVERSCTFHVRLCFNRDDLRLHRCNPQGIGVFELHRPSVETEDPVDRANGSRLLAGVFGLGVATQQANRVDFNPSLETFDVCTYLVDVIVPLRERPERRPRAGKRLLKARVVDGQGRRRDSDKIKLQCRPGAG